MGAAYTLSEALTEYASLKKQTDDAREEWKARGQTWACFDCTFAYPAEVFGYKPMQEDQVFSMCISPGYWVACSACASAHRIAARFPEVMKHQLKCERCESEKLHNHFARPHALAPWCRQSELQRDLEKVKCEKCRNMK